MSKNNKNAKRVAARKQATAQRQGGGGGPAKTQPKHGKKNAWWQKFPSYAAYIAGGKRKPQED